MAKEWVVSEEDIGCDGSYLSYDRVVRCKDCKYALDDDADPARFWCSYKWPANMVPGNGYCFRGERNDG